MNGAERLERPPDLIIGIGHPYRGDDAVGPTVAKALAARGLPAIAHEGEGSALLDLWDGQDHVVVVDAVAGGEPGAIEWLDGASPALPALRFVRSTHDLGLPEAIALGQRLDRQPSRLSVIAIAGRDFAIGAPLSPPVAAAAAAVTKTLAATFAPDARA